MGEWITVGWDTSVAAELLARRKLSELGCNADEVPVVAGADGRRERLELLEKAERGVGALLELLEGTGLELQVRLVDRSAGWKPAAT